MAYSLETHTTAHGELVLTNDSGVTWQPLPQPLSVIEPNEEGWSNAFAVEGDYLWFGTNQNRIWRSTDRGRSWTPHETPGRNSLHIAFTDPLQWHDTFPERRWG